MACSAPVVFVVGAGVHIAETVVGSSIIIVGAYLAKVVACETVAAEREEPD